MLVFLLGTVLDVLLVSCGGVFNRTTVARTDTLNPSVEPRITIVSELGETNPDSSPESSEEEEPDEKFWKQVARGSDVPADFWHIQKLIKYMKGGNQNATLVALSSLREQDLKQKLNQLAIREIGGLEVLVNVLETNDMRCQIGALAVLNEMSGNLTIQRILTDQGIVSILVGMLCVEPMSMQIFAGEILANVCKVRRAARIVRKIHGIPKLISMLDMQPQITYTLVEYLKKSEVKRLKAACGAAKAILSVSRSTKNKITLMNKGVLPLMAAAIRSCHPELITPIMGALQQCASQVPFQVEIQQEGLIPDIVQHLKSENIELKTYSAAAIFRCAENEKNRLDVRTYGGLQPLIELAKKSETNDNKALLAAVIGAIWKCAVSMENALFLQEFNIVPVLLGFLQDQPEDVIAHAAGGLAELAKIPDNRYSILRADGLPKLTYLLNRPNPSLLHANVAQALGECAKEKECMEVLDSLDTVRLIWTLLKYNDLHVLCTATTALCPCIENAKDSGEMVRSLVGGLELVINLLHSSEPKLLACACLAIAKIALDRENLAILTDHGIVSKLAHLLPTKDEVLREALVEALGNCCNWSRNCYEFGDLGVIEYLTEYLRTKNKNIRRNVSIALAQLSADPFNCTKLHENGLVPLLLQLIGSDDDETQEAAASCLANIRNLAFTVHEYNINLLMQKKL